MIEKLELGSYIDAEGTRVDIVYTQFKVVYGTLCIGVGTNKNGENDIITYRHNGSAVNRGDIKNIVGVWREPIKLSGWVNVYKDNYLGGIYLKKEEALSQERASRIACIYVSGTEGVVPESNS